MNAEAILAILRQHEPELRALGVTHAALFGSTARGEQVEASDIDILIDVDAAQPIGLFGLAEIGLRIEDYFDVAVDVIERRNLKGQAAKRVALDAIQAF